MEISVSEKPHAASIPEAFLCKSRLQEYTQKASISLPVYQTFPENDKNVPHFRSQVWVDGLCFISSTSYPNKKLAEQDAARHALIGLREKIKNEGHMRILEDTIFCKSIVNEYALKMDMTPLTYTTNMTDSSMFISLLQLNGVTHVGQMCKKKKQAEQSAARAAILSILASETNSVMSETVKSKYKLYDALQKVTESPIVQQLGVMIPATEDTDNDAVAVTGPPPGEIPRPSSLVPFSAIISNVVPEPITGATHESVHIFKKPKLFEAPALPMSVAPPSPALPLAVAPPSPALPLAVAPPSPALPLAVAPPSPALPLAVAPPSPALPLAITPPSTAPEAPIVPRIEFVPPVSEQTPIAVKKQNRKKRKAKKKSQLENPTPITMIPQSSAPAAFPMAQ